MNNEALQIRAKANNRNDIALQEAPFSANCNGEALQDEQIVRKRNEVNRQGCNTEDEVTAFQIKQAKKYAVEVLHFYTYGKESDYCPGCHKRIWTQHCTTCHSNDHSACLECGKCVPKVPYYDRETGNTFPINPRPNNQYCSNACRQKAYRKRIKK